MSTTFWSHTIWYVLLGITSIISIMLTLYKAHRRKFIFAFFLSVLGITLGLEAILTLALYSYKYFPKIVADPFQDGVLGSYFSEISISATAILLITYNLSYIWYVIFPIIYFLIEEWFVRLGIYQHNWYNSIYTLIGLTLVFWLVKQWYKRLTNSPKAYLSYITLFFAVYAVHGAATILSLQLLGIQVFRANLFQEIIRTHTVLNIFYLVILINTLINLYNSKWPWSVKGIVGIGVFGAQFILYKSGILFIARGYFLPATVLDLLGCYLWIALLDRWLGLTGRSSLSQV